MGARGRSVQTEGVVRAVCRVILRCGETEDCKEYISVSKREIFGECNRNCLHRVVETSYIDGPVEVTEPHCVFLQVFSAARVETQRRHMGSSRVGLC